MINLEYFLAWAVAVCSLIWEWRETQITLFWIQIQSWLLLLWKFFRFLHFLSFSGWEGLSVPLWRWPLTEMPLGDWETTSSPSSSTAAVAETLFWMMILEAFYKIFPCLEWRLEAHLEWLKTQFKILPSPHLKTDCMSFSGDWQRVELVEIEALMAHLHVLDFPPGWR